MMDRVYFELAGGEIIRPHEDYGILLVNRDMPAPKPRIYTVELEGVDGELDLTEWSGVVLYSMRECTINLRDMNGKGEPLIRKLNGRRFKVWFSDERGWYYTGRCTGITDKTRWRVTDIEITLSCDPYRTAFTETVVTVSETTAQVWLKALRRPVYPFIEVTGESGTATIEYYPGSETRSVTLDAGDTLSQLFHLDENGVMGGTIKKYVKVTVTGGAAVKFKWQDGDL